MQETNHAKFIEGLSKLQQDNAEVDKLLVRLDAVKADARRILADRLDAKGSIEEELRKRIVARAANKDACRAAAIDSTGSDKAATTFGECIAPRLQGVGMPGLSAVAEGILSTDPCLGSGKRGGNTDWAAAMDQRFPMLVRNADDAPQTYDDKTRSDLPWYQRPSGSFCEASETIDAVRRLKEGFQARGQQIKADMGLSIGCSGGGCFPSRCGAVATGHILRE